MEKLLNEVKQYRKEQAELLDWNKHNGHPVMVSFDEGGLNACDKIIAIIERALANAGTSEKDLTGMRSYGGVLACHIGHNTTVLEELVRAVENKTGETVICVNIHKDEMDFFNKPIVEKEPFIIQAIDRSCCQMLPIEKPSHKRPYKFHR